MYENRMITFCVIVTTDGQSDINGHHDIRCIRGFTHSLAKIYNTLTCANLIILDDPCYTRIPAVLVLVNFKNFFIEKEHLVDQNIELE